MLFMQLIRVFWIHQFGHTLRRRTSRHCAHASADDGSHGTTHRAKLSARHRADHATDNGA
jgi:hypothetical protein